MRYKKINVTTMLEEVRIKSYRLHTDETIVLAEFGSMTAEELLELIAKSSITSGAVKNEIENSIPKEVMLSYHCCNEEVLIDFVNTASDVESEWLRIPLGSEIVADSIMLSHDLVLEAHDSFLRDSKGCKDVHEYYKKFVAKEALINVLVERFAEEEFKISFFGDVLISGSPIAEKEVAKRLRVFPTDNLKTILTNFDTIVYECGREKTYSVFMSVVAKAGMAKFDPYISKDEKGHYSLVLKYNRFVHLFRGYHYQCSYTEEGIGEYSSSGIRIDRIKAMFDQYDLRETKLLKYLYYMNLINCCQDMEGFNRLLCSNSELVDEFMRLSTQNIFDEWDVTYNELVDFIVVLNPTNEGKYLEDGTPVEPQKVYRIPKSETTDIARIYIYSEVFYGVELWVPEQIEEVLFTFPMPWDSKDQLEKVAEYWDETPEKMAEILCSGILSSTEVKCAFTAFALNHTGFVTNFLVTYPKYRTRESKLRALNRNDVELFNNLSAVCK